MVKTSIRKFLLINLLLAITVTTTLTAIGNYYLDQKDIQEHLDSLMAISALSYEALIGEDIHQRELTHIQNKLDIIPEKIDALYRRRHLNNGIPSYFLERFNFQIWSRQNHLLLHSSKAPQKPLITNHSGFSDQMLDQQNWRIFSTQNQYTGIKTVIAERYDTRNELGQRIAQDDLYIMLLTFPLSGLLIWIIIGRGLRSLKSVAEEVSDRQPNHLEPVDLEEIPDEIKPLIDELNKLFYRLKEGFEREKRFAADAAHELRTPLAALKTQAQVALNSKDIDEKNLALKKLIASVNRSTHIVQQLLTMSRLVPDAQTEDEFTKVNLAIVTRDILAMLAQSAIEKQIDLELEVKNESSKIHGNATALGILVRNLVDNAIRYTNNKGKILVKIYQDKNRLVLEVADNGPGIPSEFHDRVFERFFRVLGNKATGSGLGLAIAQQIAALHHANITLDAPKTGTGLIVRIDFPLAH